MENLHNEKGEYVYGQANIDKAHTYLNTDTPQNTVETLNHEITHHNGLGETSAQKLGKLNTFAYNIGTSLNKEEISKQRQLITPTAQMLESLSQEDRLAVEAGNQAVLDGNLVQQQGEIAGRDGFFDEGGGFRCTNGWDNCSDATDRNIQRKAERLFPDDPELQKQFVNQQYQDIGEVSLLIMSTAVPTSVYEVIPIGKGFGIVKKGSEKVLALFEKKKDAQKVLDRVKSARVENNIYRDDDLLNQPKGGQQRVNQHGKNWAVADLRASIKKFAGDNPIVQHTVSGKTIYKNRDNGIEVVYDKEGDYFRILDPSIKGKRKYLGLDGQVPNNKTLENGKQIGRTQDEYNAVTHFKVKR